MSGASGRPKRFYKAVDVEPREGRYGLLLDGKPAKTASRKGLSAPTEALARAVAGEWEAQKEFIDRHAMPLTGILSASIDGGATLAGECREDILNYLQSDLVCYRAEIPAALAERQAAVWNPYIDFMRSEFGALLVTTSGIVTVGQPATSVAAVRRALAPLTVERLFALRIATAISGSAVLALALWKKAFGAEAIFEASRVDERFQQERWGVDEEAAEREARLRRDFLTAARFLALL
jgi:chaperone required for assembly of F1-ATPase